MRRIATSSPTRCLGVLGLAFSAMGTLTLAGVQGPWDLAQPGIAGAVSASSAPVLSGEAQPVAIVPAGAGAYSVVTSDGGVYSFGGAPFYGSAASDRLVRPIVGAAATPDGHGYWLVSADGGVFAFGDAAFYGSMAGHPLDAPVVGIAPTPDGHGYWLVSADGGVFAFGDAAFYGSMAGHPLNAPVVGVTGSPSGGGYWLVAGDGGVFAFGTAGFYGSMGSNPPKAPVVGISATATGYRLVASDGGVFDFGNAGFYGSMGGTRLDAPVVGAAPVPGGNGYWMVASDGGIFAFGDAQYSGRTATATPSPAAGSSTAPPATSGGNSSTGGSSTSSSGAGALSTPPGYSASQLIWQDNFSGTTLDSSKWNTYMTSIAANGVPWNGHTVNGVNYSAIGTPSTFAEVDSPNMVSVNNGLSLNAAPGSPVAGYNYTSSVVDTYGKFGWSGGYFQARVKVPDVSTGYWPSIWFLPAAGAGTGGDAGEFDLMEGGMLSGSIPVNSVLQSTMPGTSGGGGQQANAGVNLSAGWHTYAAQYIPGKSLTVYFDGRQTAQFTQNVPTWPLQLIMNLEVAASQDSGWHTTGSPPAASMQVSEIQFYS